ncbi:MAG: HAMP domain-containing protein [Alteromonadaceae bacterium]|nr:HAMP domain-containing protein [Alteromonadaceae bacterium]
MIANLRISHKIYFQGLIQLILMIMMGGISIYYMSKIGTELFEIAEEDIPLTKMLTKITEHKLEEAVYLERALFKAALFESGRSEAQTSLQKAVAKVEEYSKKVTKEIAEANVFVADAFDKLHSAEAIAEFQLVGRKLESIDSKYEVIKQEINSILSDAVKGDFNSVVLKASDLEDKEDALNSELVALLDEIQNFTERAALTAEKDEQFAIKLIIAQFVFALIVVCVLPFWISKLIATPVNELRARLQEVADGDGDLKMRLNDSAKDETGEVANAFNHFMDVLSGVIKGVVSQTDSLGKSAETALHVMDKTLVNVEKQRDETEQVATAIEEMSVNTKEVAQSTNLASQVAENVRDCVTEGRKSANETQDIIQVLAVEVKEAGQVIENLVSETNNIDTVLQTIQSIAEQTNLLALNAAIEAARAGESGRGFAVVADEVRSLAQRAQESTVDIQNLVQRIQNEANNAVGSMNKGSESVEVCLEKGQATAKAFEQAADAVNEISDLNVQVAAASEQQSMVAQEINQTVLNIKNIADETAEGTKETVTANSNIAKRLIDLHKNINVFQV